MKKIILVLIAFVLFSSHDMFLKLDTYFLPPDTSASIELFNGTFDKSENIIDRNRMIDISLVGNGERTAVKKNQWSEKDSATVLNFRTGKAGTWVAGISTAPRTIEMAADDFNNYLEHDGITDMLEQRRENEKLENDAVEQYAKHVKAIFQIGTTKTEDWKTALGYPVEFIPQNNPYELNTGDELKVQLLREGEPLADQLVYADYRATGDGHSHETGLEEGHSHEEGQQHEHNEDTPEKDHEHDHEHGHGESADHSHDHEHEKAHEEGTDHTHSHEQEEQSGHSHSHDNEDSQEPAHTHQSTHDHEHEKAHEEGTEHTHSHEQDEQAGHSHSDDEKTTEKKEDDHQHTSGSQFRTDSDGMLTMNLNADGIWYLRTIDLVESAEPGPTHESNWATLTFEVTHSHGEDTHVHSHEEEGGIPSYVYWIASFVILVGLFLWFNRKN